MFPLYDTLPGKRFPFITVLLICVNTLIFALWQNPALESTIWWHGFRPCEVASHCASGGTPWPLDLLSSMFLHVSWEHLLGNMLFLWIFGNNVEEALGKIKFLIFYLLAGAAAALTQMGVTLLFAPAHSDLIPLVGASGAIAGILGAYFILFSGSEIVTFWLPAILFRGRPTINIGADLYILLWLGFQLIHGGFALFAPASGGGVAFFAHIGGIAFGMMAVRLFTKQKALVYATREAIEKEKVSQLWPRNIPGALVIICIALSIFIQVKGVSPVSAATRELPQEVKSLDPSIGLQESAKNFNSASREAIKAFKGGCHQRANDQGALRYRKCILLADQKVGAAYLDFTRHIQQCNSGLPLAPVDGSSSTAELNNLATSTKSATAAAIAHEASLAADNLSAENQLLQGLASLCVPSN